MSGAYEAAILAALAALALVGALLWAREGVALWIGASAPLCF